ncbi:unnamed protein product [Fusarium venenatum]|uniref:Zn(2)-C6 fungal-type domain-containing protein n=1 Tax=Fusarium venenatum TaxID=56646 RepID=A0A2L2T1H0_9HYPO|nr:uncharacterized protein FVRRES_07685 [Fusarium venenatum]KAH6994584.1 hypothetical protein EDB82DRAFT_197868 [Fusarium venenatum]CEI63249.1 unnamed protein product [Fusarium venenatum]
MASEQQRPPRVLACVLCQQRKKKCDRKSPCSFCTKAGIQCIPSTPAPKRSRRKPTKELLARLERCEELLKRCSCVQKSLMYSSYEHRDMASPTYTSTEGSNGSASPEREKLDV